MHYNHVAIPDGRAVKSECPNRGNGGAGHITIAISSSGRIDLVWSGKKTQVERVKLPLQVIERVNDGRRSERSQAHLLGTELPTGWPKLETGPGASPAKTPNASSSRCCPCWVLGAERLRLMSMTAY